MTETLAWQPVLQELLAGYENGLYTRLEVPSKAIDMKLGATRYSEPRTCIY